MLYLLKDFDNIKINLGDNNKLRVTKNKRNYLIKGEKLDLRRVLNQRGKNKDLEFNSMIDGSLKVDLKRIFLPGASLINYKNTNISHKYINIQNILNLNICTCMYSCMC